MYMGRKGDVRPEINQTRPEIRDLASFPNQPNNNNNIVTWHSGVVYRDMAYIHPRFRPPRGHDHPPHTWRHEHNVTCPTPGPGSMST